uniref:Reverse transcriptase domain-containing protein n=1 Tax=Cacopsylla melanoneura TaxID=428564 RepID=A0A8D8PQJ2_9HEMI
MLNALSVLFADDTSIILKNKATNEIKDSLITVLDQLMNWFQSNNFVPNLEKTNIVKFSTNYTLLNEPDPLDIVYNNQKIPQTSVVKFLGIHVDEKLSWKTHIDQLNSKIGKFNFALRVITKKVGKTAALISYYAFVQSNLTYGIIFWGNSVEAERIFISQKSCIRSLFHLDYRASCKDTMIQNNILSLPCLYIFECAKFVKKHYNEFYEEKETKHTYNTRAVKNKLLNKPKTQLTQIQKNVEWQSINIYNKIPSEIKMLQNSQFTKELGTYLKTKCLYSISEFMGA